MDVVRILIVEDENIVALDLRNRLRALDYEVLAISTTGEDALKKTEELHPDLVLMDILLRGEMTGIEAAEQIKNRFEVPVIYLTAYADDKTLQRAKLTEPFGYVLKPFEERELHTTIEMALYRHKMNRRLKESEQRLATILNSIGDAVIATDPAGLVTFMNPVAAAITGWNPDEAMGKRIQEVFHLAHQESTTVDAEGELLLPAALLMGIGDSVRCATLIAKTGAEVPIDFNATPMKNKDGITGLVLAFRDITERKQAEEAIAYERKLLHLLMDNIPDTVYFKDKNSRFTRINKAQAFVLGLRSPDEAIGKSDFDFFTPEHAAEAYADEQNIMQTGRSIIDKVERIRRADGEFRWVSTTKFPIMDREGQVTGVAGVTRDITERKRSEFALLESEARLRAVWDSSVDGMRLTDENGVIVAVNRSYCELVGMQKEELEGQTFTVVYASPQDHEKSLRKYQARFKEKRIDSLLERQVTLRSGKTIEVELGNSMIDLGEQGTLMLSIFRDITARKQAEEALRLDEARHKALLELNQMTEEPNEKIIEFALEQGVHLTQSKIGYLAFLNEDETELTMHSWSAKALQD